MGVDCPDIRRVVHWGMPATLEEYIQETGRAGRDSEPSLAILYQGKGSKNTSARALQYQSNTVHCRRRLLFEDFLMYSECDFKVRGCSCCDVCETMCDCVSCK